MVRAHEVDLNFNKLMPLRLVVFSLFLFIAYSAFGLQSKRHPSPKPLELLKNSSLPTFNQVTIQGNISVRLYTGYSRSQVALHGNSEDLLHIKMSVINHHLSIALEKKYPQYEPIFVDIRLHDFNGFTFKGKGSIVGHNLRSNLLDLSIHNNGSTTLDGQMMLRKLALSGNGKADISGISSPDLDLSILDSSKVRLAGVMNVRRLTLSKKAWVSMYWVNSDRLCIRARGQSFVQLAGTVKKLDVELWDQSQFNGRYLRADRSFVKTHGKSIADILAISRQHTLATDNSNIYFYSIPTMKTDFMAFQGSVLDMHEWSQWDLRDYDRYNK